MTRTYNTMLSRRSESGHPCLVLEFSGEAFSFSPLCWLWVCHKWLFVCVCVFLGLHLWHMEIPRLGVESELQLSANATAIATRNP